MSSNPNPFRRCCATSFDVDRELDFSERDVRYAIWQKEKCPDTGRIHYQLYLEGSRPHRFKKWKEIVGHDAHIEEARKPREACIKYCSKEATRVEGEEWHEFGERDVNKGGRPPTKEEALRVILQRIASIGLDGFREEDVVKYTLYKREIHAALNEQRRLDVEKAQKAAFSAAALLPWHQSLLNTIDELIRTEDRRKIIWVWSADGNQRKSWMAAYLRVMRGAVPLGAKLDAAQMIYNGEPLVTFDIPRSQYEFIGHFYTLAETLRNGEIVSSKYMSEVKVFNPPVIVFFANQRPDYNKWSADRLIEFNLNADSSL